MCMAQKEGNMGIPLISTTTLQKTGTVVKKALNEAGHLVRTVEYGKDTPMVKKYGIKSIEFLNTPKTSKGTRRGFNFGLHDPEGKSLNICLEDGKIINLREESTWERNTIGGNGTFKEKLSSLLDILRILKSQQVG